MATKLTSALWALAALSWVAFAANEFGFDPDAVRLISMFSVMLTVLALSASGLLALSKRQSAR